MTLACRALPFVAMITLIGLPIFQVKEYKALTEAHDDQNADFFRIRRRVLEYDWSNLLLLEPFARSTDVSSDQSRRKRQISSTTRSWLHNVPTISPIRQWTTTTRRYYRSWTSRRTWSNWYNWELWSNTRSSTRVPTPKSDDGLSKGALAGIIIAGLVAKGILWSCLCWCCRCCCKALTGGDEPVNNASPSATQTSPDANNMPLIAISSKNCQGAENPGKASVDLPSTSQSGNESTNCPSYKAAPSVAPPTYEQAVKKISSGSNSVPEKSRAKNAKLPSHSHCVQW